MNTYITNQTRNLKTAGLALLVASSILLTEGCATSQKNTYNQISPQRIVYVSGQTNSASEMYSDSQPKKERSKILKFFDGFFSTGALSLFAGF